MDQEPSYDELLKKVAELERRACDSEKREGLFLKLSHAVDQSPSAVMITDIQGVIEYVNPRFTEMTGYKPEAVYGMNASELGNQSSEEEQAMWEVIRSGKVWQGEFYNKKTNGEYYWERASISSIKNEDQVITHFVKISEDITELKKAQEDLRKSEEERYKDQQRLAILALGNDVALKLMDELRNPLAAIGGFAKRILHKDCPNEKLPEYSRIIFEQSKRLDEALNRALSYLKEASRKS